MDVSSPDGRWVFSLSLARPPKLSHLPSFPKSLTIQPQKKKTPPTKPVEPGLPRTLEFRQSASTLCPASVQHWLTFIIALVRLAERRGREGYIFRETNESNEEKKEGGGERGEEERGGEGPSIWKLMEEMELGVEEVRWWKERKEREKERV